VRWVLELVFDAEDGERLLVRLRTEGFAGEAHGARVLVRGGQPMMRHSSSSRRDYIAI
jgi:hypothetical protein